MRYDRIRSDVVMDILEAYEVLRYYLPEAALELRFNAQAFFESVLHSVQLGNLVDNVAAPRC
jgi:hypothetical protein